MTLLDIRNDMPDVAAQTCESIARTVAQSGFALGLS
jgi:hypothetical protein